MPDTTTTAPASPSFEKLKLKLRELFELDKADLDFGIYRILRQRHTEITEFLDKHLEKTVREALTSHGRLQQVGIEEDLRKAEAAAHAAGITLEQSPRVMELREKYGKGADLDATADEVYSHLFTFFSRYYQGGDFLGLHRSTVHGREKYMIPYNGEEVKLVWANMDQYYIKSSDLLRDYTFLIRKADLATGQGDLLLDDVPDQVVVQFELVEADTEKDNRKPDGKMTRGFVIDTDRPFEDDYANRLRLRFRYLEHPSEKNLQDKLNVDTEKTLAHCLPPRWKSLLFAADPSYKSKDKKDTRTIFRKHLRSYTSKFLFDYFIHKDLGGFLRRELDFYIKNEVMHLDDIEGMSAPRAEEYLSKVRAIRQCALPVIRMLTQLEEFQKKLWLKKKFVVETRYCLTLDRVPEALYQEICTNEAQWKEWEELYTVSELTPSRTQDFLRTNSHLMVDTRHFDHQFTCKLLASIENIDSSLNGVCFHSENFQALQLVQERYREEVKCVYIDPPYNTGTDGFSYRDDFQHSCWITMMENRTVLLRTLLKNPALFFCSVDRNENRNLLPLLTLLFGEQNFVEEIIWQKAYGGGAKTKLINSLHEYIECFSDDKIALPKLFLPPDDTSKKYYKLSDDKLSLRGKYRLQPLYSNSNDYRGNLTFPLPIPANGDPGSKEWDDGSLAIRQLLRDGALELKGEPSSWRLVYAEDSSAWDGRTIYPPKQWQWEWSNARTAYIDDELVFSFDEGQWTVNYKQYELDENGEPRGKKPPSVKIGPYTQSGTDEIKSLFNYEAIKFPKPSLLIRDLIAIDYKDEAILIADTFAGSGTTGHAIINLNREIGGNRKYLLVEMGEYFDAVLVPRLKKVVYSTDWKEGKPQTRNTGISQAFKIVRLEGYEDTLNNLSLHRTVDQEAALAKADELVRSHYLLSYFLDVESAGSKSLLDLTEFRDPFAYKMNITTSSAGETKETTIDLVETFNWLLGLKVDSIKSQKGFLRVEGYKRAGGRTRTLIIWRTLSDDPIADNETLDAYLGLKKVKGRVSIDVNPADTDYDFIYVNGSHTLNDPHNKVHLIEETFQRLMFDTTSFESLS